MLWVSIVIYMYLIKSLIVPQKKKKSLIVGVYFAWHPLNPIMDNALHMLILDIFQLQMYWFDPLKPNKLILSYTNIYTHSHICPIYCVSGIVTQICVCDCK